MINLNVTTEYVAHLNTKMPGGNQNIVDFNNRHTSWLLF